MSRQFILTFASLLLLCVLLMTGCAEGAFTDAREGLDEASPQATATPPRAAFPEHIPLPTGFQPEGITIGRGTRFYVGSLADGSVYGGDLRTCGGTVRVPPQDGRVAVGLDVDERSGLLRVAGGPTGDAYAYDAATGEDVAVFE